MTFQVEFNELKNSLESTVEKNPVLNKEHEFLLFSQINSAKNSILRACLEDDNCYKRFVQLMNDSVVANDEHSMFMFGAFDNEVDFDKSANDLILFVRHACSSTKKNVLAKLQSLNVAYDVYKEISDLYTKQHGSNVVLDTLAFDMQYHINKVYLSNVKLLLRVISSYRNTVDLTVKDLFSEGAIGLRRAIELFNCSLGIKFSTYATQWIKATINRAIADKDSLIRIPVNIREQLKDVERIKKALRKSLGRDPEESEIIERMKKKSTNLSMLDTSYSYYNIDSASWDREDSANANISFEENLIDRNLIDECDSATIKELRSVISDYISSVANQNDKYYLKYYFGFNEGKVIKGKEEIIKDLNILPNEYDRIRKRVMSNMKRVLGRNKTLADAYSIEAGWESNSNLEY